MMKWNKRLADFDSANSFGIKTAIISFTAIVTQMTLYIITDADSLLILGFVFTFIMVIVNIIVVASIIVNLLIRGNRIQETLFTLYIMALNIPVFAGLIFIKTFLIGITRL